MLALRAFLTDPQTFFLVYFDLPYPTWICWQELLWHFEFKIQDMWIGVFWKRCSNAPDEDWKRNGILSIWITLLPMFPLHIDIPYKEK